jgi:hypothetical protein
VVETVESPFRPTVAGEGLTMTGIFFNLMCNAF